MPAANARLWQNFATTHLDAVFNVNASASCWVYVKEGIPLVAGRCAVHLSFMCPSLHATVRRTLSLLVIGLATPLTAAVIFEADGGPVSFGAAEISAALESRRDETAPRVMLSVTGAGAPESFRIRIIGSGAAREIRVEGADAPGVMYGALELAETLRLSGLDGVRDLDRAPHLAERGVKFNLPLDARSPSYSDASDSAQRNIATVWDISFWHEFIDRLARDRYNLVSLWNLHPFPSLVRVPEYPDIALADVQRSTAPWQEHYALQATGLDTPEILGQVETLRRLSIDEKISFWREVMRYGRSRNVKFYVVTWNIFTNGIDGKHGITPDRQNATTADYFRRSVRELVLTYPDLAGLGLTTGEFMPGATAPEKEDWAFRTYGQGVLDALALQPQRKITFIHRQHEAGAAEIRKSFAPLLAHPRVDFVFSFKYAEAHALAAPQPRFHQKFVADIGDAPVLWTLRNDDNYIFRWGAPDFVRAFVRGIPAANTRGFYYGSDQWIWGREFLDLTPPAPDTAAARTPSAQARPLELAKHDYHWLLWGRLGYDPDLPDDRFIALLHEKFPATDARVLFAAWQDASMIYPLTTAFHWGALDFQWYIEGCRSRAEFALTPTGFHDINRFISLRPHPATDNLSIPDFVAATRAGKTLAGTTPPEVAGRIQAHADRALTALERLASTAPLGSELWHTLEDIRAMAHLGHYYAHKIRAATALAQFRSTLDRAQHAIVAAQLNQAACAWRTYAATAVSRYANPLWTNRVGIVDWRRTFASVLYDLTIADVAADVPSLAPTPGGTVLEAEDATGERLAFGNTMPGFTGRGYLDFDHTKDPRSVTWTFNAREAGLHVLEFRYAMRRGETSPATLAVNGATSELMLWPTGGAKSWMWDRKVVFLRRGENKIALQPGAVISLDHLNVLR
ncbi:MAG: carbohydrate-binding family 6 protein [Undibacterium sp.]|nr:carbohydrate-binding family 6 protein [Opitutaceae bacterium]